MFKLSFVSEGTQTLNEDIFESVYFGAREASREFATRDGAY